MTAITVCVPVHDGAAFVAETLDSIAAQRLADFRVLISLDPGVDASETICRRYLADRRFQLVVQPRHLGWVGNVNALIARVDTEHFCIVPQDDILDARYLAELFALAASDPRIVNVFCDVQGFGAQRPRLVQREIRGERLPRVLEFLLNQSPAVAFRGLVRRRSAADRPYLLTTLRDDFGADTVWLLQLALRGELRRVPAVRYRKRYYPGSVHAGWLGWPRERLLARWAEQAAVCVGLAEEAVGDEAAGDLVRLAGLLRVQGKGLAHPGFPLPRDGEESAMVTDRFCAWLGLPAPPSPTPALLARPEAAPLAVALEMAARRRAPRAGWGGIGRRLLRWRVR